MRRNVAFDPAAATVRARFDAQDVAQLRQQCEELGLGTGGGKIELVNRLVQQEVRSKDKNRPTLDRKLLRSIGSNNPPPDHLISGLDLAPLKPPKSSKPLQGATRDKHRLPPLTRPQVGSHGPNKSKGGGLSAEEARNNTIRNLVSHAFEWPADEVAQQHEERTFPHTKTGQRMSCWAPELDVEHMGILGGVGLRLYFTFLQACALMFAGLTVLSAPTLYLNYYGSGLADASSNELAKTTHGNLFREIREAAFVECTEFDDIECCKVATEAAALAAGGENILTPSCGAHLQELYYTMTCTPTWTQSAAAPTNASATGVYDSYADLCSEFCINLVASCGYLPMLTKYSSKRDSDGDDGDGADEAGESDGLEMWNEVAAAVRGRYSSTTLDDHRQCFLTALEALAWADAFDGWGALDPGDIGRGQRPSALYVGWSNDTCVGSVKADPEFVYWKLQLCALCDCASLLFLLCWYLWLVRRHDWIVKDQDDDMISMSDYTVQVVCRTIPEDLGKEELLAWMEERFGTVVLLEMCVDNDEAIRLYEARSVLLSSQERLIARSKFAGFSCKPVLEPGQEYTGPHAAKLTDLASKIEEIELKIQEESKRRTTGEKLTDGVQPYKTISAFVTFETDESFELAMKWEKMAKYREKHGSRMIRDGYEVHLQEAPEPDTIIWEHLEYGEVDQRNRRFGVNCIVVFILSLSFFTIVIVNAFKSADAFLDVCPSVISMQISSAYTVISIPMNDSAQIRVTSANEAEESHQICALVDMAYTNISGNTISTTSSFDLFAACFEVEQDGIEPIPEYCEDQAKYAELQRHRPDKNVHSACYQCLCDNSDPSVDLFETLTETTTGSYCENWEQHSLFTLVANVTATALAVVFNQVIKVVMAKIVDWEKPHTLGAKQSSLMVKVFLAQLCNTALIVVLINLDAEGIGIVGFVLDKFRPPGAYYDDFTNEWYNSVGAAIISTMVIQNLFPPCSMVLQGIVRNYAIRRKRRSTLRRARGEPRGARACLSCACLDGGPAYTEHELRDSVNGQEFKLAASYAEAFLLVFVSLIYGSGMPILYPLAVCGLSLKFFSCKWAIVSVYRDPPMWGPQFGYTTQHLLPFAILLHCCFGILVWGRHVEVGWAQGGGFWLDFAGRALGSWLTAPLTAVAFGMVFVYVIWTIGMFIMSKTETECEKRYRAWKEKNDEKQAHDEGRAHQADAVPDFSTALRKGLFVDGQKALTSYAIQDNPDYAHAFSHLPQQKDTVQYQRIQEGIEGKALSLHGVMTPPVSPRDPLDQMDEKVDRAAWAVIKWEELIIALLELRRPELNKIDAKRERDKAAEIARRKWRAAHPPQPKAGQYVISRRMWLHQLYDDVAMDRSVAEANIAQMRPLNVSNLPLSDAWKNYIGGSGGLPMRSAGDVYCPGDRTERELYEYQRVNGAGGGLGAHYFLRRRPRHSPGLAKSYPNDPKSRAERQRNAASQMINRAEDEFFGGPTTIGRAKRSMLRRDFTGAINSSALREYSKDHRHHGKVEAAVIVHPFDGKFTEREYTRWREAKGPQRG